jgi:DNA polymerase III delta subunit
MPVKGFYYTYGNDTDMVEQRWLPDLESRYPEARWLRLDATIDDIDIGKLTTEYYSNAIFSPSTVIVVRNADHKHAQVFELAQALVEAPVSDNALVLIGASWNKTTKLGKLVKKSFVAKEFSKPELKPFDLLDSLNTKSSNKVLQFSNLLFDADYHPLAMFSLVFGHFLLLRKIKELDGRPAPEIARTLGVHNFRIQKAMVACRHWTKDELAQALQDLGELDARLRTWQYDERMLIQMALIKLCL